MPTVDEMMKAFGAFTEGVQGLAVTKGINDAHAEVQTLKDMQIDDMAKRQQQEMIAKQLAMKLTAAQASPTQMQGAMSAFMPEQIKNSADAFRVAASRPGDGSVGKYGEQLFQAEQRDDIAKSERQFENQSGLSEQQYQQQRKLLQMQIDAGKFDKAAAARSLTSSDTDKITKIDGLISSANDIMDKFQNDPSVAGAVSRKNWLPGVQAFKSMTDADFASFKAQVGQDFDKYRTVVTGASSGPAEMRLLMANRPSMDDSPAAFAKKYGVIVRQLHRAKANMIKNHGKNKRDISGYQSDMEESERLGAMRDDDFVAAQTLNPALQKALETAKLFPEDPKAKALLDRYSTPVGGAKRGR